ncbi:peptidylprolyl isomerase [Limnobacter litoralis]|uniref:PpiC domain-containing protein n=1 Tax=Limnobacter litoralis TaxID=481366 RepID=A0ABQ5YRJ7_9BURK|nr:peptidylprolyl isomerase [Limnobacter litoralis]GLR25067.1 hypothetical protein GCM10007875_01540 [Limnobacter litoralis]
MEHITQSPEKGRLILVTPAMRQFVREQISDANSLGPTEKNYDLALTSYLNDEVLYREGMRLGLDQDDLIVRRRVIQKMRFLMEDTTPLKEPRESELQDWLDNHTAQYQTGQSISFEQIYFSTDRRGDQALFDARKALSLLRAGKQPVVGDPFPQISGSTELSHQALQRTLGTWLTDRIFQEMPGQWSEPIVSPMGVFLVKVNRVEQGRTMTVQEAGERLINDVKDAQRRALNEKSLTALKSRYTLKVVN